MQYNEISKVMSDRDLVPLTKRAPETATNVKKNLISPQTVRGQKESNSSNTLKEAAKQLILNNSFVQPSSEDTARQTRMHFNTM